MIQNPILDNIKRYIEEKEISFLIGAGFSRNVNKEAYPLWGELLKDAIWGLFGNGNRAKREKKIIDKAVKDHGYLGIASMIVQKAGYHEAIDTYIEGKTPFMKSVDGKPTLFIKDKQLPYAVNTECHELLKNLEIQNIYTFNYDNALEFLLGEDKRKQLECIIGELENEISKLQTTKKEIEEKERKLSGLLDIQPDEETPGSGAVKNDWTEAHDSEVIRKERKDYQDLLRDNNNKIRELYLKIEAYKLDLRTFYSVVKDSCDISLSARRKSIYKIHGSLRENESQYYGFDGDSHTQYIITQEDYDTYNDKHGAFVNMMRIDLLRNRFCIIGVSGSDSNFLAWINWVKDVLDKTKDREKTDKENHHQSYFIYSGNNDMPEDMVLMLKNHFILPVVLKDIFPSGKNDEERVKLFLEYVQPLSNKDASKLTDLWSSIDIPKNNPKSIKRIPFQTATELIRLSGLYKFQKPQSIIRYVEKEVQYAGNYFIKDGATIEERMTYAAAIQGSLLPMDLTSFSEDFEQMEKEKDENIKKVFIDALRRSLLLRNISPKEKGLKEWDYYAKIVQGLYSFIFPTVDEVHKIGMSKGNFVRHYSLLRLLQSEDTNSLKYDSFEFKSAQEYVLAADWLKSIGYKDPLFYCKADDYKQQDNLLSLREYCLLYLAAMKRKENLNTYGYVSETIYMDKHVSDVINGAILLNSFVELGIGLVKSSLLEDQEWHNIVIALKERYTEALIFYTIVRNEKDSGLKFVAQEMMYNENSRKVLPSVLYNLIASLAADTTPEYLKGRMAQFALEILPAVDSRHWSSLFSNNAVKILDIADKYNEYSDIKKSLYGFVAQALEYSSSINLKLSLLKRILERDAIDDRFEDHLNTLAISARSKLKPSDFFPLVDTFMSFAKKTKDSKSQQAFFVVLNLMPLLYNDQRLQALEIIEERALKDAFMTEGYARYIQSFTNQADSFKKKFVEKEDLWHTGISDEGVSVGLGYVSISRIDKHLHFDEEQVNIIFNDLKTYIVKVDKVLNREGRSQIDRGWISSENTFREMVMDMRLFVHNHHRQLEKDDSYEAIYQTLIGVYEQCFFRKDVYQLIADDEIYRAIRRMMVETEMFGIDKFRLEYEQIIGRIIAKDTNELGIAFRHTAWAMGHYSKFFNSEDFRKLFRAVLQIYKPYFDTSNKEQISWNLIGCQKEVAEYGLVTISKTLAQWGYQDEFWGEYKRVFNFK